MTSQVFLERGRGGSAGIAFPPLKSISSEGCSPCTSTCRERERDFLKRSISGEKKLGSKERAAFPMAGRLPSGDGLRRFGEGPEGCSAAPREVSGGRGGGGLAEAREAHTIFTPALPVKPAVPCPRGSLSLEKGGKTLLGFHSSLVLRWGFFFFFDCCCCC